MERQDKPGSRSAGRWVGGSLCVTGAAIAISGVLLCQMDRVPFRSGSRAGFLTSAYINYLVVAALGFWCFRKVRSRNARSQQWAVGLAVLLNGCALSGAVISAVWKSPVALIGGWASALILTGAAVRMIWRPDRAVVRAGVAAIWLSSMAFHVYVSILGSLPY